MAATAATQGIYRSTNTRKDTAASVEGKICLITETIWALSASTPLSTASVLTTLSLAIRPVITAVEASTEPKPAVANTGAISPAILPSILSPISEVISSRKVKFCRNQTISVARKITVKARCRKSFALSHICRSTLAGVGRR